MEIYGIKTGFSRTIKATIELIEICPDKDIKNLGALITGGNTAVQYMPKILAILQNGYENRIRHEAEREGRTYEPKLLTAEDFEYLDEETYQACVNEAFKNFKKQSAQTVHVREMPGKKTENAVSQ